MLVCLHNSKTKADYGRGPEQVGGCREWDDLSIGRLTTRKSDAANQMRDFFGVGACVRLTVRPVSTCQKLSFVWKIETFDNDLFPHLFADLMGWRKRRYRLWMPEFSEQSWAVCATPEDDVCRQRQDGLALPAVPEGGCVPLRADRVVFGRGCWSFILCFHLYNPNEMSVDNDVAAAKRCCAKVGQIKTAHGSNWGPCLLISGWQRQIIRG